MKVHVHAFAFLTALTAGAVLFVVSFLWLNWLNWLTHSQLRDHPVVALVIWVGICARGIAQCVRLYTRLRDTFEHLEGAALQELREQAKLVGWRKVLKGPE